MYTKKLKLSAVCSNEAYEYLQKWILRRYDARSYPGEPNTYFYRQTSHREYLSRFLEDVITKLLRGEGADPIKANDKGHFIDKTKIVTDVVGRQRKIGSGDWVKSRNVRKGRADIVCFYKGQQLNIEVKVGRDRQSVDQIAEQRRAEMNGERYIIVKTVDDFLDVFDSEWRDLKKLFS